MLEMLETFNPLHLIVLLAYLALLVWGLIALWRSRVLTTLEKTLSTVCAIVVPFLGLIVLVIVLIVVARGRQRSTTSS